MDTFFFPHGRGEGPEVTAAPAATLPRAPVPEVAKVSADSASRAARDAALAAQGVPRDWIDGVNRLEAMAPPHGFDAASWAEFVATSRHVLDAHGAALHVSGRNAREVFGIHPVVSSRRPATAGLAHLLVLMPGTRVGGCRHDGVIVVTPDGVRRRAVSSMLGRDAVPAWQLAPSRRAVAA